MFPSKTHYKLCECFELLGPRLFGDDVWTGTEASAKYPGMLDRTIRTLSSYLARPKLEGNVVDFAAHKTSPILNETAPETKSLDKLVRYGKLAREEEMDLVDVIRKHDPDFRAEIQRSARGQQRRHEKLVSSTALALAAASGTEHGVENILGDFESEGEFRALQALYEGGAGVAFEAPQPDSLHCSVEADMALLSLAHTALAEAAWLINDDHPLSQEQHGIVSGFGGYIKEQAKTAEIYNRQTKIETELIQAAGADEIHLEVFNEEDGSLTPITAQACLSRSFSLGVWRNKAKADKQPWPEDGVVAIQKAEFDEFLDSVLCGEPPEPDPRNPADAAGMPANRTEPETTPREGSTLQAAEHVQEPKETRREKQARETKEKHARWYGLAREIKGEGKRWARPAEIAGEIAKREKGSMERGVNTMNIRRRLDDLYPGWAE